MKEYKITDSELIQKINDNNEDAKDYLYQKYSLLIHKEVNRIKKLGIQKGIEYNDLLQESQEFIEIKDKYDNLRILYDKILEENDNYKKNSDSNK